jgi:tetratricopeptide (TPR) repeat protein
MVNRLEGSRNAGAGWAEKGSKRNVNELTKPVRTFGIPAWLPYLLLVFVTLLAYLPAWNGKPIWDDDRHLTPAGLRSWDGLARIWTEPHATSQYYPLVHSVFWVEHKLWGDSPLGYHLVNILLHALAALLLLKILRLLEVPGMWLAAAVFALHPIQVESVAWISELKNTLSGVFYFGSALAYLRFDRTRSGKLYAMALGLFILALLSKTVTATLPAALLVIFWWKRGKISWRQDLQPLTPFFLAGIAAGLFTAWIERKFIGAEGQAFDLTIIERCLIAGRAFWFYLAKLCWPARLVFIYPRWNISQAVWWQYLFPAAALLLFLALWGLRKKQRGPFAGVLFFAVTLFPALGFLNVYPFRFSFVADHFQYLAGAGVITLASAGAVWLSKRWRPGGLASAHLDTAHGVRPSPGAAIPLSGSAWKGPLTARFLTRAAAPEHGRTPIPPCSVGAVSECARLPGGYGLCAALLAILACLTWRQCEMYKDADTLWHTTIAKNPRAFLAYNNLGFLLLHDGRPDEAIPYFKKALQIHPAFVEAHNNLGHALVKTGQMDEAFGEFQQALEIDPNFADAHYNFGDALASQGRLEEAIAHFKRALEIAPDSADTHYNLGNALLQTGPMNEAIVHFQRAVEINPGFIKAHNNLGVAFMRTSQLEQAAAQYQQALELAPNYADAHYNLGVVLGMAAKLDAAVEHYRKAIELNPSNADAHGNLANVLAAQGKVDAAIGEYQRTIELSPGSAQAHFKLGLALEKRGSPQPAISQYQEALRLNPNHTEAKQHLRALEKPAE